MSQALLTAGLVHGLAVGDLTGGELPRLAVRVAHGVGTRKDLPIPFAAALGAAVVALVASFVALGALWKQPRLKGSAAGRPLPGSVGRALDAPWFRWTLRGIGLVLTAYFLLALLVGLDDALNPSPGVVYVLFWVGTLVVASVLLGPVWRMLNPLRTLHLVGCRVLVRDPDEALLQLPRGVGQWPAAFALLSFGWLELVAPNRATLPVLRVYLLCYVLWVLVGAVLFGARWLDAADGFEVMSSLYGRLSILGRRGDGVLVTRSPLNGIAGLTAHPGTAGVICVLLATTAYDGLSASPRFANWVQTTALPTSVMATFSLCGVVLVVGTTYFLAARLSGRLSGVPGLERRMPRNSPTPSSRSRSATRSPTTGRCWSSSVSRRSTGCPTRWGQARTGWGPAAAESPTRWSGRPRSRPCRCWPWCWGMSWASSWRTTGPWPSSRRRVRCGRSCRCWA